MAIIEAIKPRVRKAAVTEQVPRDPSPVRDVSPSNLRRNVNRAGRVLSVAAGAGLFLGAVAHRPQIDDSSHDTGRTTNITLQVGDRPSLADGIVTLQAPIRLVDQRAAMQPSGIEDFTPREITHPSDSTAEAVATEVLTEALKTESNPNPTTTYQAQVVVGAEIIAANDEVTFGGGNGKIPAGVNSLLVPTKDVAIALNNAANNTGVSQEVAAQADAVEEYGGHMDEVEAAQDVPPEITALNQSLAIDLPEQGAQQAEPTSSTTTTTTTTTTPTPTPTSRPTTTTTTSTTTATETITATPTPAPNPDASDLFELQNTGDNTDPLQLANAEMQDPRVNITPNNQRTRVLGAVEGALNHTYDQTANLSNQQVASLSVQGTEFFVGLSDNAAGLPDNLIAVADDIETIEHYEDQVKKAEEGFAQLLDDAPTPTKTTTKTTTSTTTVTATGAPEPAPPPTGTPVPENPSSATPAPSAPPPATAEPAPAAPGPGAGSQPDHEPQNRPDALAHTEPHTVKKDTTLSEIVYKDMGASGVKHRTSLKIYAGVAANKLVAGLDDADLIVAGHTYNFLDKQTQAHIANAMVGQGPSAEANAAAGKLKTALLSGGEKGKLDYEGKDTEQAVKEVLVALNVKLPGVDATPNTPAAASGENVFIDVAPAPAMSAAEFTATVNQLEQAGMIDQQTLHADTVWDQVKAVPGTTNGVANQIARSDVVLGNLDQYHMHHGQEYKEFDREMVDPLLKRVNRITPAQMLTLKHKLESAGLGNVYDKLYRIWAPNNIVSTKEDPVLRDAEIAQRDRDFTEQIMRMQSYIAVNNLGDQFRDLSNQAAAMSPDQFDDFILQHPRFQEILLGATLTPPPAPGGTPGRVDRGPHAGAEPAAQLAPGTRPITVDVDLPFVPETLTPPRIITVDEQNSPALLLPAIDRYGDLIDSGAAAVNGTMQPQEADEIARQALEHEINEQLEPDIAIPTIIIPPITPQDIQEPGFWNRMGNNLDVSLLGLGTGLLVGGGAVYLTRRRRKTYVPPVYIPTPIESRRQGGPVLVPVDASEYVPPREADSHRFDLAFTRLTTKAGKTPEDEYKKENINPDTNQPYNRFSTLHEDEFIRMVTLVYNGVSDNNLRTQYIDSRVADVRQNPLPGQDEQVIVVYDLIRRPDEQPGQVNFEARRRDIPARLASPAEAGSVPSTGGTGLGSGTTK